MKVPGMFSIKVIPNAPRNEFAGRSDDGIWKVKITSPPVDGAANKELIRFLAHSLGIPKSKVKIVKGFSSRWKLVDIDADEQAILKKMESILP